MGITAMAEAAPRDSVLIVDDTLANLRLLTDMLRDAGYDVRSMRNGQRALDIVRSTPIDLVLLDINMPDMDGYEVCQRLNWRLEAELSAVQVRADANKLRQVLTNLLGNACKFTPAGEVAFKVGAHSQDQYLFEVIDAGPGITPEQRARIFESFHQEEEGRKEGGTGLGLAIARRHVELMGGELALDAERQSGARFFFSLPLPPALESVAEETHSDIAALKPGQTLEALVVDDVATNRDIRAQFLTQIGVIVHQATGGEAALSAIQQAMPESSFSTFACPTSTATRS